MSQLDRIREKKDDHLGQGRQLPVTPSKASSAVIPEELPTHASRKTRKAETPTEVVDVENHTSPSWSVVSSPPPEG